jgi:hypothetical protein
VNHPHVYLRLLQILLLAKDRTEIAMKDHSCSGVASSIGDTDLRILDYGIDHYLFGLLEVVSSLLVVRKIEVVDSHQREVIDLVGTVRFEEGFTFAQASLAHEVLIRFFVLADIRGSMCQVYENLALCMRRLGR